MLIVPSILDDERGFFGKIIPIVLPALTIGGLILFRRRNRVQEVIRN